MQCHFREISAAQPNPVLKNVSDEYLSVKKPVFPIISGILAVNPRSHVLSRLKVFLNERVLKTGYTVQKLHLDMSGHFRNNFFDSQNYRLRCLRQI